MRKRFGARPGKAASAAFFISNRSLTRTCAWRTCPNLRRRFVTTPSFVGSDPQAARPTIEPLETFAAEWTGELILVTSRANLAGELARFDFSWFIPSIVKHRRPLGEVLTISLFLQLFALVSPLFFQVVMDKVLVQRGMTTLDVLVIGLVVIMLFESVFSTSPSRAIEMPVCWKSLEALCAAGE